MRSSRWSAGFRSMAKLVSSSLLLPSYALSRCATKGALSTSGRLGARSAAAGGACGGLRSGAKRALPGRPGVSRERTGVDRSPVASMCAKAEDGGMVSGVKVSLLLRCELPPPTAALLTSMNRRRGDTHARMPVSCSNNRATACQHGNLTGSECGGEEEGGEGVANADERALASRDARGRFSY